MIMYVPETSMANTVTVRPVELVCFSLLNHPKEKQTNSYWPEVE